MTHKGRIVSAKTRRKMSEAARGKVLSEEHKKKISEALKGRVFSEEHKRNLSESHKGKRPSEETRRKMSEAHKGRPAWNKGLTKETDPGVKKISETRKGQHVGSKNPNWRGGTSNKGYGPEWTPTFRRYIVERDGSCMFPECGTIDKLCPHHIDYDRKNHDPMNLITLCKYHNSVVNFNREHWEKYFTSLNNVKRNGRR